MRPRSLIVAVGLGLALVVASNSPVAAAQTFPDPFGGDGIHSDIRSGAKGEDIGDAFFLRDGGILRIRLFLDAPNTFIESHVCLSAQPFTGRVPPGQCQYAADGATSGTYDIVLPPSTFPSGTVPFSDPLGPMCAQVHLAYAAPGLARTARGGGSAFAGWQPGSPFYGSICFAPVPDPEPPDEGTAVVSKSGAFAGGDVTFTVTVENPTTEVAADVVVWDALPPTLAWTLPPDCTLGADDIARCDVGDLAGGASLDLVFTATPAADQCGTFLNHASTFVLGRSVASHVAYASVDVPCPPDPPADPLILLTKEPSSTVTSVPGTITYIVQFENAGPGDATNVTASDDLPAGIEWSIGSGSNVCSISGSTLTCFAELVPDGVFEVLEIVGTLTVADCGTLENEGTVTFEGGPQPGSVTAVSPPVEVIGCPTPTPESSPDASAPPPSSGEAGEGEGEGEGELPDTRARRSDVPVLTAVLAVAFVVAVVGRIGSATRARGAVRRW